MFAFGITFMIGAQVAKGGGNESAINKYMKEIEKIHEESFLKMVRQKYLQKQKASPSTSQPPIEEPANLCLTTET